MAWTLQPRSYMQAIRPNLYNLAYRRTGAYKGLGWLGQTDSVSTTELLNLPLVGPYFTMGPTGPQETTAAALNLSPPIPSPFGLWIQQNGIYVAIGIAVFALFMGGRRR